MRNQEVRLSNEMDIVFARQAGREMAKRLGFGSADQTRLATAISELARNVIRYAGTGIVYISDHSDQRHDAVRVIVEDHGPGIPDIELAMQDGYSTGSGLGAGLPGTRRLMHEFSIESRPGLTMVTIGMRKSRL